MLKVGLWSRTVLITNLCDARLCKKSVQMQRINDFLITLLWLYKNMVWYLQITFCLHTIFH